ncbi:type I DNA topoisomerase [Candidatus Daviesbacteria bacterium]|nr:type I DNA topoisomerase [Candidatus Daviesbacteria bacterium]
MSSNLVIVESPTKARTLSRFLGSKYSIEASMGHVRDLPKSELGVDTEHNFEPKYIIPRDKKKRVNELKKIVSKADNVFLATDPDREGEAIAWHIEQLVDGKKNDQKFKRVVFHEITEDAIKHAFSQPRNLDYKLIDAQQARRVLDRLVGYKLSPLLWKKVKRGLSAGRVQTVALRLVVEREKEIQKFKPQEYWTIEVVVQPPGKGEEAKFFISLIEQDGKKIEIKNEAEAKAHVENLKGASYFISKVTKKQVKRTSAPPFTTSTLQQAAGNKLRFTAKKTMMLAQNLYERGFITYMRTDSVNLSTQAVAQARSAVEKNFGKKYLPASPKFFKSQSKNAQEAHEAIRPTNLNINADNLSGDLGRDHKRLYDLIFKRMVASQMADAILDQTSVDVTANMENINYLLRATGSILKFDGWLKLYGVTQIVEEEEQTETSSRKQVLPELTENEKLNQLGIEPTQHFTQPPPRYTEASLVKRLEELGIGRPSTYAPILSTIQERYYVEKEERKFKPTALGIAVVDYLVKYFPDVFDYEFTASMENSLDDISRGERVWQDTISNFYKPFEQKVETTLEKSERVKLELEKVDKKCPECGKDLVIRIGRFGKFLACSGFPDCKHTEGLEEVVNVKCPNDGGEIVVRRTKKGRIFYGCKNYPNCKYASWTKPK